LQQALVQPTVIQIARTGATPPQYVWPWALVYSYPLPNYGVDGAVRFCKVLEEWSDDGKRNAPPGGRCPHEDEPWHQEDVLCPFGFWGLKHTLEQPLSPLKPDRANPGSFVLLDAADVGDLRGASPRFGSGLTQDQELNQQQITTHIQGLATLFAAGGSAPQAVSITPATTRDALRKLINRAGIGYFLCHGETDAHQGAPFLGIGPRPGKPENRIYPNTLVDWALATQPDIVGNWGTRRPLIFINGCHTTDLGPGAILNFVSAFATLGAGGVIGTEVSVRLPVAIEMAEAIFNAISKDERPIATALRDARWALANKGNLLGLAYTLYGLANYHLTR
jgi:hypothetical protein